MSDADTPITVAVSILDRDYQVACSPAERDALLRAADHLDAKMRQIRATGKIVGLERIAVMAALNLTHEALSSEGEKSGLAEGTQREVDRLSEKLGRALGDIRQLKI
ncbi:MAG: cell division protein ZapA [Pseudomonadales bacterium]|jgi:cell division protein ZapA|nr:cell division protein ZapA [Pseudomonadales bacterium]